MKLAVRLVTAKSLEFFNSLYFDLFDTIYRELFLKPISFFAVFLFYSALASAQQNSDTEHSPPLLDHEKIYIELALGAASQKTEGQQGLSLSGDSFSLGVRSGYAFNRYFSAELGYSLHGTSEAEDQGSAGNTVTSKISPSSIDAAFKATLPLSDQVFISARAGMANWSYSVELSDTAAPNSVYTGEDSGYDPFYGGGIIYKPNDVFYFGLEYSAYEFDFRIQGVEETHKINTIAALFGAKI